MIGPIHSLVDLQCLLVQRSRCGRLAHLRSSGAKRAQYSCYHGITWAERVTRDVLRALEQLNCSRGSLVLHEKLAEVQEDPHSPRVIWPGVEFGEGSGSFEVT